MTDATPDPWVVIGAVTGAHGVRGWVKVRSYTEPAENLLDYSPWWMGRGGEWHPVEVAEARLQGGTILAHLDGCDDRDAARALAGGDIAVLRSRLPPAEEGHYYWVDLVGLEVRNLEGAVLGTVDGLLATGANDVLVVRGERERLIPFVRGAVVTDIDLNGRRMTVDWDADF